MPSASFYFIHQICHTKIYHALNVRILDGLTTYRLKMKKEKLATIQREMSVATSMISQFKKGMVFQSHSAAKRNTRAIVDILTPEQSKRFLEYRVKNSRKLNQLFAKKFSSSSSKAPSSSTSSSSSLNEICEKLTNALNLPTQE